MPMFVFRLRKENHKMLMYTSIPDIAELMYSL